MRTHAIPGLDSREKAHPEGTRRTRRTQIEAPGAQKVTGEGEIQEALSPLESEAEKVRFLCGFFGGECTIIILLLAEQVYLQ